MRFTLPIFIVLLISCVPSAPNEHSTKDEPTERTTKQQVENVEQANKATFDYTSIVINFPALSSLTIDSEQLQKSSYTKYHPERDLNNYYFELSELTSDDKGIVDIESKDKSRLFYFGRTRTEDSQIVIILKNDTTSEGINDTYIAQLLDSANILVRTFELAKIDAAEVEESTKTTSEQIGREIIRTTVYELFETPMDEEPVKRTEKKDTVSLN